MPDRCKLMQAICFLATLGNNILTHPPQLKSQICPFYDLLYLLPNLSIH